MSRVELDPKSTALVLIDLQNGIMGRTMAPYSASDVVKRAAKLADAVRSKGGTVVYVRVDVSDMLRFYRAVVQPRTSVQTVTEISIKLRSGSRR